MNISRLAVLAVIFMMVLSTFVAIPAYNASADHENHDDEEHDHDHDGDNGDNDNHGLPPFSDMDENGNGTIEFDELLTICPEDQSEEQCMDIFNQYSGDDGVIDEDEYQRFVSDVTGPNDGNEEWTPDFFVSIDVCYDIETHNIDASITSQEDCDAAGLMWVPANSGPSGDDDHNSNEWRIQNFDVVFEMEDLSNWVVKVTGNYPVEESDRFREDLAQICEDMMGGNPGEITKECYENFLTMEDDDGHDGHDDHYGQSYCYDTAYHEIVHDISQEDCTGGRYVWVDENDHDDHGHQNCPPGLTDDECEMMEECLDNNMVGMSCQRMMYDYCNDNPNACDSHDNEGNFFYAMFAYEDGDITAEEFISNSAIQSMFNNDDDNDDGTGDPSMDWGQGRYDLYTFNSEMDGKVKIHPDFIYEMHESPNFICGNGGEVPFNWVNDGYADCEDGADEQWYDSNTPNDTSDDCQEWNDSDCVGEEVNWFDCHDGTKVWINQVNNGEENCEDGEDEYHSSSNSWHGNIYLLSGEFTGDSLGTELTPDHEAFMAAESYYCGWADNNKTHTNCSNTIDADLVAGDTYTLVTVGMCHQYDGEEMMCNTGNYRHTMEMEDGSLMNMSGNVSGDHPLADFSELANHNRNNIFENFVLYNERNFAVSEDGFHVPGIYVITSLGNNCHDHDGDGENDYCYGTSPSIYLYENFNTSDTESGLIASADHYGNEGYDCSQFELDKVLENCNAAILEVELSSGNYTVVIAHHSNSQFYNIIEGPEGGEDYWGELHNAYHTYENGSHILVEGNDRIHMPYSEHTGAICTDDDGNEIDCDDLFRSMELQFELMENMTAYEDGDMNATTAADNVLGILYAMADEGFFDHGEAHEDDHHDDHHDDVYWSQWNYCEWEGDSSLQYGDMRWYCTDNDDGTNGFDDWWYYCEAHDDGLDGTTYFCTDDFGQSADYEDSASNDHYVTGGTPDGYHDANHHGDEMWYCEDCNCQDMDDAAGYGEAPDGYRQCGGYDDDDYNSPPTPQEVLSWGDANNDSLLSFDEFVATWIAQADGENDDSDDDSDGLELEEAMAMYNESDSNGDGLLNVTEIEHLIQLIEEANNDHDGHHDDHGDGNYNYYDYCNDSGDNYECYMDHWEDHNEEYYYEDCTELEDEWVCEGDPDQHRDHDDHDDHDERDNDDNPALLDGIIGTQDPEDAGDDCRPSADDPHLLGNVDDNAGHPLTCNFEFKLHFEGVDESLDSHVAYIPFLAQDVWTLKMENAIGYEVTSCDNCVMGDDGVMTGTGPVNLTLSKVEPQPDCDYVVGLSADGMAFDPVKLAINVGETVCWQWKDAAMAHNVVELEGEYDSTSNLTAIDFGFSSGDPAMTVDFRHTFTEDNKVHYYVCAPHAQLGMVGQVTVGNGTDDPIQQAIEDEEVPSLGFVFGSLVLVGAAGLRRRIH